jgi:hypothetical protein
MNYILQCPKTNSLLHITVTLHQLDDDIGA